jgi:hypothetical protein
MKLWRGKKRLAKKYDSEIFTVENKYNFFINLKPGDIYYGYDGFNHRLKRFEITWYVCGKRTKVVDRIELEDQSGSFLNYPYTADLPHTKEEIIQWWKRFDTAKGWEMAKEWGWSNFLSKLVAGEELFDDDGVLLNPDWRDND